MGETPKSGLGSEPAEHRIMLLVILKKKIKKIKRFFSERVVTHR